jgi:hypothetical protein
VVAFRHEALATTAHPLDRFCSLVSLLCTDHFSSILEALAALLQVVGKYPGEIMGSRHSASGRLTEIDDGD